jgi:acyl CoA:acetate/3-ketoacid CoA transferase alpha subunit
MIQHTPLNVGQLSPAAQRALGPGPGRTMAARGLLPLPPADQIAVLYQLSLEPESTIAQSARATAAGLPDKLLAGALATPTTDPRVLDYFASLIADKPSVFDAIALNPAVADDTIVTLAGRAGSREVDQIAQNEQRLLRHPEIIAAMYMNRRARMSTIDRVVELAVRNHVRVPGLAAWDELARALTGELGAAAATDDALFEAVIGPRDDSELTTGDAEQPPPDDDDPVESKVSTRLVELQIGRPPAPAMRVPLRRTHMTLGSAVTADARLPDAPAHWLVVDLEDNRATVTVARTGERHQLPLNQAATIDGVRVVLVPIPFRDLPIAAKIRAATLGDAFVRGAAIRDPLKLVSMAAIKSPGVTDIEAARYARNQALAEDVVRYIAANRNWTKLYGVKVSLCRNPKAPIAEVARMLPFLRPKDLANLSKSKGVPSAVANQARKLISQRGGRA